MMKIIMMMMIRYKVKDNVNFPLPSHSLFIPFSHSLFIPLRTYCSLSESALVMLLEDIELIYTDLTKDGILLSISRNRFNVIQQEISLHKYTISPLKVFSFSNTEDQWAFIRKNLSDYPDIQVEKYTDLNHYIVVMPNNKEDGLILMGLAMTLLRLSYGCVTKANYHFNNRITQFFDSISKMDKVDRLYRIDLSISLKRIPISKILDIVKPLVGDGYVYNLISSFMTIPYYYKDELYANKNNIITAGNPPYGEISRVLFNIYLIETFDREFEKIFPGIPFTRFQNEVIISTRVNDKVVFDENAVYELLHSLCLEGKITYIEPGEEEPLYCYGYCIFVEPDRSVIVCDPHLNIVNWNKYEKENE